MRTLFYRANLTYVALGVYCDRRSCLTLVALIACASLSDRGQASAVPAVEIKIMRLKELAPNALDAQQEVTVRGIVTSLSGWNTSFFLQDETGGISVDREDHTAVASGDEVTVRGFRRPGAFAPVILSHSVNVIRRSALPAPVTPSYEDLAGGAFDSQWIRVHGLIHSARIESIWGRQVLLLGLSVPGGFISVHILDYSGLAIDKLVDSAVTLDGACATKFNDRRQIIGLRLFVPSAAQLRIDTPAPDPAKITASPVDQLQRYSLASTLRHRLKIRGTLTYISPEHGLYLEQNGTAIHVETAPRQTFHLGDRLEAFGFALNLDYSPGLQDAQITKQASGPELTPAEVRPSAVIEVANGFSSSAYDGRLVEMTATLVEQIPNSQESIWLLRQGNTLFQAELGGPASGPTSFEADSTVKVVGVCVVEVNDNGEPASFHLLSRSSSDIAVVNSPYWERSIFVLMAFCLLLLTAGVLLWIFERQYAAETLAPASLTHGQTFSRFERISASLSGAVLCLTSMALIVSCFTSGAGWSLFPAASWITQLCLSVAACAIFCGRFQSGWKARCSLACSLFLTTVGGVALWKYQTGAGTSNLQSAGVTIAVAFCFFLLGASSLLQRSARFGPVAQLLMLGVGSIGLLNLATRLYHASAAYGVARHSAVALPTAACVLVLSMAAIFSKPGVGFMTNISSSGLGGLISRRLLPAAFLIPILLGWLRLQGQLLGFYDSLFGLTIFALSSVFFFACSIWASASVLNRLDFSRSQVEYDLRQRDQRLELLFEKSGIGDFTWDMGKDEVHAHPMVWHLYGEERPLDGMPAAWFTKRQHAEDAALIAKQLQAALASRGALDLEFRIVLPGGAIRWLSCRGNVVCDDAGRPTQVSGLNIDITARKQSEEALIRSVEAARQADLQLKTALEFSKIAVWRWNSVRDDITWKGPVEEVYGIGASELTNIGEFERRVHPDDLEPLNRVIGQCLASGGEYRSQFRIITNGQIRWIAGRGGVIRDEFGAICGMSGVNFDITSTKVAEGLLRQSERSFRELADAMPQIVWTSTAQGAVEYYNHKWYAYTGSTAGQRMSEFIHPDDLKRSETEWLNSLKTSEPFNCEQRLKNAADNSFRWHLCRALPIRDKEGEISRWFGTFTDIDDYKRVQAEIHKLNRELEHWLAERSAQVAEVELRYRLLVDGVKDYAIFMLDASGHIKSWNQGAAQLTGYEAFEVVGQHVSKFYRQDEIETGEPERALAEAAEYGSHSEESWRVRKDGRTYWANIVTTPFWEHDQVSGYSKIIRDMTEQREAMSLLVTERQNAELANQAKSNFLASMSHEIRTPMNAILGMADLLSETDLDETQREYVERFQRAGSTLLAIINDLLDLSKIESGHFELEEVPFDLEEVSQRVVDLVAPKAHRKGVNLAYRIVPGVESCLIGDPNRLQQILLNLLGNAAKFTERGEIVLTIRPHADGSPNHIHFEVTDTGIGIPRDKISAIFDDFIQAESSTTRRFGGTGLGLGIARRLVGRMGGTLTAQSELGKGSSFIFDAFFRTAPSPAAPPKQGQLEDLYSQRILIVDRNQTNQHIYREMCAAWMMRPEVTNSASQAIALISEAAMDGQPFSVLMLDRFSEDLDAFEALPQVHGVCPGLPVILITAEDHPGEATRAKACGFAGYLVKPIRRINLLRLISMSLVTPNLPYDRRRKSDQNEPKPAASSKVKLLVADDSDDNRFLIEAYLAGTNYEVAFASDGKLAIEQFSARPFDLVLMDIQMPLLDGLQATAAIRALEKQVGRRPVPIIALTGNAMPDDMAKSKLVGCNAHLSKPISKTELLKVLKEWLELPS